MGRRVGGVLGGLRWGRDGLLGREKRRVAGALDGVEEDRPGGVPGFGVVDDDCAVDDAVLLAVGSGCVYCGSTFKVGD